MSKAYHNLTLPEKVAQLFMLGYDGLSPNPITHRFLERGLGGLIFFRDNFDALPLQTPQAVAHLMADLSALIPAHLPHPLMGIDQEGGQVERLPHTLFPSALTPRAVALANHPEDLAETMYRQLAENLLSVGLNLDFFPTLDVNFQPNNPIIGVRSFGDDAQTVWRFSQIALQAFERAGLIAVGKHFPGHGNGTVDSHLDLPTLHFTLEELTPFQQAIHAGVPVMLVAHGYYPELQTTAEEKVLPASASPAIIQGLLRQQCGFQGVIITDDMCMGAITKHRSPVEAALASLKAGVDILLYKQSTEAEWGVYEAVLHAFQTGVLPLRQLEESLQRIITLKTRYLKPFSPTHISLTPEQCTRQAEKTARQGINTLSGTPDILPLKPNLPLLIIHPERESMGNYAFDVPTSASLGMLFEQAGFTGVQSLSYPPRKDFSVSSLCETLQMKPEAIVFVSFNPLIHTSQVALYEAIKRQYPHVPIILASVGTAYDLQVLSTPALHLSLCSYRPATMWALANLIATGFAAMAQPVATESATQA
jgi:beta-N-acetylhexosaminidase